MRAFWCRVGSEGGKGCDADKAAAIARRVSSVSDHVSCAIHCDTQAAMEDCRHERGRQVHKEEVASWVKGL
jgi:hypothetical protein